LFREKYLNSKDKSLEYMQKFVDSNIGVHIFEEDEQEAFDRIYKEGKLNKDIIEEKLKKEVHTFCWPWGHRSNYAVSVLEKAGYTNFVTTVKGTNSLWGNNKKIRRVELRNFTLKKFILNVEINRNLILGRLYELVS
jgi:rhodanese-related sulfurtransferase